MSIWSSRDTIGYDDVPWMRPPGEVLTYADGYSNHYPTPDVEKPASVGTAHIPSFCVPGHEDESDEDAPTGPWLRLHVSTWDETSSRPMIADGATVILDVAAARSLAKDLLDWADSEHAQPTNPKGT